MKWVITIKRKLEQLKIISDKLLPANGLDILDIFGIALVIIAVLALFLYPPIAKQPQKITDFYYDFIWTNTNKSGELHLLTFLIILGIGLIAWLDTKRKPVLNSESSCTGLYFSIIALPLMLHYFIHGWFSQLFLILGVIFIGLTLIRQQYALKAVFAYAFIYFACIGIFTLFKNDRITEQLVTAVSLFIFALILWGWKANKNIFDTVILATQIFIPFCLFIFLRNEYIADGRIIVIPFPNRYIEIFTTIIIGTVTYAVLNFIWYLRRINTKEEEGGFSIDKLILITTLGIISAYRVDIELSQFVPPDFWHYGEKVICWQQIIELGKVPYKDYFSSSGLYSIVNGFFLNTVFDGTATYIFPALTFEHVFYAFLIAVVLSFAAKPTLAALLLFIAPISGTVMWNNMPSERAHLIYLSLSILALPAVWKDINRWLKVWGLLVVANILNYPVYGMSLAIAGIPYALCGIYLVLKRGIIFQWLRKPLFYVSWIAVFAIIIPFIPLVLRIVGTSAIISNATVQFGGIALLTNPLHLPEYFPIRIIQYTVLLTTLTLAVIIPGYILIRLIRSSAISKIKGKIEHPLFYFSTIGLFFLPAA
jgi:hypothetical protein